MPHYSMYGGDRGVSEWHSFLKEYFQLHWKQKLGLDIIQHKDRFVEFIRKAAKLYHRMIGRGRVGGWKMEIKPRHKKRTNRKRSRLMRYI